MISCSDIRKDEIMKQGVEGANEKLFKIEHLFFLSVKIRYKALFCTC